MEKSIFLNGKGFLLKKITDIEGNYFSNMDEFVVSFKYNNESFRAIQTQVYENRKYYTFFSLCSLTDKSFIYQEKTINTFSKEVTLLIDELMSIVKIRKIVADYIYN